LRAAVGYTLLTFLGLNTGYVTLYNGIFESTATVRSDCRFFKIPVNPYIL